MIKYTKKDMKVLHEMSVEGSPARVFLEEGNYSPDKLLETMKKYGQTKDIGYLFEMPLHEVPLLINQGNISGYLKFRLKVGK